MTTLSEHERVQHTPGPWRVDCDEGGWFVVTPFGSREDERDEEDELLVVYCAPSARREQRGRDAQLIAAAPDLLAACRAAYSWLGNGGRDMPLEIEPLRAHLMRAIAKAVGG